jgi:hypothetical protein
MTASSTLPLYHLPLPSSCSTYFKRTFLHLLAPVRHESFRRFPPSQADDLSKIKTIETAFLWNTVCCRRGLRKGSPKCLFEIGNKYAIMSARASNSLYSLASNGGTFQQRFLPKKKRKNAVALTCNAFQKRSRNGWMRCRKLKCDLWNYQDLASIQLEANKYNLSEYAHCEEYISKTAFNSYSSS